jgi:endonuclease/exonuclease/phosphatase family metal-dependent hydrolase
MRLRLLVFVCFIQACAAWPVMAARNKVTYLSANILYCNIAEGEKRSDYVRRREALTALLAEMKPDVIGIQEASICKIYGHPSGDDTIKELVLGLKKKGLNYGSSFWVSESIGTIWIEGLAFLWNEDAVSLDEDHIACRHLDTTYRRSGTLIQKSLCRAEVSTPVDAAPLLIYNTHFESCRGDVRDKQSLEVIGILGKEAVASKKRALFGGDLNSADMGSSFESAGFQLISLDRVDYIFSHGVSSGDIAAEVIPLHSIPGKPDISDHNGILVTVWDE